MPTSKGRRALVASLLMLLACLSSGFVSALAEEIVSDPAPETPPASTETTVTTTPPEPPAPTIEDDPAPEAEPSTSTTTTSPAPATPTTATPTSTPPTSRPSATTTSTARTNTPVTIGAAVTPTTLRSTTSTTLGTTTTQSAAVVGASVPASTSRGAPTTTTTTVVARTAAAPAPAAAGATDAPALADTTTAGAPDTQASVSLDLGGVGGKPSQSLLIIVLITLLAVAPALLIMLTSFTRIVIVLSLTRNALGLHTIPPNQVIVGLAMFLSFFVMSPTFGDINRDAIQPLLKGEKTQAQAYESAVTPLRTFMLKQTRKGELAMFSAAANGGQRPEKPEDVGLAALIPAFILSELKTAFIIGFVIFIPFLVIDIVVSSSLMSMGMMMLPPVFVSLPFKLLLFVMVDGWGLVVRSLLKSFA
jgi:flagellar biosynthetic protein FliP